jgi:hypothetical protein
MYSVTGTDGNGCQNSAALTLTVNPLPVVTAGATSTLVCSGHTAALSGNGANIYYWSGGVSNNIPFAVFIAATYSVTGVDVNGCTDTASIFIQTLASPQLSINSVNPLICAGETTTLTAGGAMTYTWNTPQNSESIVVSPTITTTYTVTGSGSNGCSNVSVITQSVDACVGVGILAANGGQLTVYPNPNNGAFFISLESEGMASLAIYNLAGQQIVSTRLHDRVSSIDISTFSNGIYVLETTQGGTVTRTKLIKN